jgi:hypothetical protein
MKRIQISLFCVIIISIISCHVSPLLVYRLEPKNDNTIWFWGKEYQQFKENEIEIIIAFSEQYENYLVFDLSIASSSDKQTLIKPEEFYCIPKRILEKVNFIKVMDTIWAIDPEQALLALDKAKSRENAQYATARANDALGSLFKLTIDIATIGQQKTNEEIQREELEDQREELNRLNTEISHNSSIKNINNIRDLWSTEAIRKTTLFPKYSIHGLIFFPIHKYANTLTIIIPIENNIFTLDYCQVSHKPNKY